jgi:hypothetical protein
MFKLVEVLFGCTHRRYTFPITTRNKRHSDAANVKGTYVVCLDCGKEFPYDWHQMKVMESQDEPENMVKAPGKVLKPVA